MKKILLTLFSLTFAISTILAVEKSDVVVYIGGTKYYIHTVQPKETLYAISREYNISTAEILEANPAHTSDLQIGEDIKIPFNSKKSLEPKLNWFTRRRYTKHEVVKGETLYSISRKYAISVETIIENNPHIDPTLLSIGDVILIRKKEQGKTDDQQLTEEWNDYKDDLNRVAPEGYQYHIIQPGETLYSLSRRYQMSEEEFSSINDLSDGFNAGAIVLVRATAQESVGNENLSTEEQTTPSLDEDATSGLRALDADQKLNVAIMLPLSIEGRTNASFVDFYNGFLLGLEDIKNNHSGYNIEITLYNTQRDVESVKNIINQDDFKDVDLIVGPVYEDIAREVVDFADKRNIPVVSPLASFESIKSDMLFQMAPLSKNRYSKLNNLFAADRHITLIYTESIDKEYEAEILSLIGNRPYSTHNYEYARPVLKKLEDIEEEKESKSDLMPLLRNGENNTIVILSSDETNVDRVLSAVASASNGIISRGLSHPRYNVVANPKWTRFKNIDTSIYFADRIVMTSSYHAKRSSNIILNFDSRYITEFNSIPSLYAYRGYDAARIFVEGMYGDIENMMQNKEYTPLQTKYRFEKDSDKGIIVNTNWVRANYTNNYKINIE